MLYPDEQMYAFRPVTGERHESRLYFSIDKNISSIKSFSLNLFNIIRLFVRYTDDAPQPWKKIHLCLIHIFFKKRYF